MESSTRITLTVDCTTTETRFTHPCWLHAERYALDYTCGKFTPCCVGEFFVLVQPPVGTEEFQIFDNLVCGCNLLFHISVPQNMPIDVNQRLTVTEQTVCRYKLASGNVSSKLNRSAKLQVHLQSACVVTRKQNVATVATACIARQVEGYFTASTHPTP